MDVCKISLFVLLTVHSITCIPKPGSILADVPIQKAVCVMQGKASGKITVEEYANSSTHIYGFVANLETGKHGFHIHEFGDLTRGCASAGGHYNPHNKKHGGPTDIVRHVGDLGNIFSVKSRWAEVFIKDKLVKLSGENSVVGRAIVVHKLTDDLGKGGNAGSVAIGNAGARVGCCIIAHAKL